jgi:hypothetical protein
MGIMKYKLVSLAFPISKFVEVYGIYGKFHLRYYETLCGTVDQYGCILEMSQQLLMELSYLISTKYVDMALGIHGTTLYYGSTRLKIRTTRQSFMEVSLI